MRFRRVRQTLPALALLIGVSAADAQAQQGRIQGTVTAADGRPLSGVAVGIVGTNTGAFTNDDGQYTIDIAPGTYDVQAVTIGYAAVTRSVTVVAGQTAMADFTLETRTISLDELVVSLEAGDARRAQIGTDLELFDAESEVDKAAVENFSDLLKGRTTGVSITESSGSVGAASTVRVRGSTSLTQDNNPIIYIDGVRVSNQTGTGPGSFDFGNGQTISRLDDLNPADIASVQILKGPTAAAQYGSEAAAGVILVTTKTGRRANTQVTFQTEQGASFDYNDYWDNYYNLTAGGGITDLSDSRIQQWNPVLNPVTGDIFATHNPLKNPNTDPFRTAHEQSYALTARGGIESVDYFLSARYEDMQGVLPNNGVERYSFRANVGAQPATNLDVDVSTNLTLGDIRLPDNDRSAVGMITNAGAGLPLFSYGTLADGTRGDCLATVLSGAPESLCEARQGNLTANFDKLATIQNTQEIGRFIASVTANWRPSPWLSTRFTSGLDFTQTENRNLVPLDPDRPFGGNSDGVVNDSQETGKTISVEGAATGTFDLTESFSSATTVGAQFFGTQREIVACSGRGFASATATACNAALTFDGSSDKIENNELGAFFQQRFGYRDYLFVTGSVRVDDNSAFGDNLGAIVSPSANVSAVLSDMPFWNIGAVNDFRFRFAWGKAAQAPAPFAEARTFRSVRVVVDGAPVSGISLLSPGNPDLAAERNEEFEVGFDGSAFNDRLGFKLTYYNQKTTDAIVATSVAPSTGFSGTKFVNLGEITNHGFEAQVGGTVIQDENVTLDMNLGFFTQDPKVTDLGDQPPILFGLGQDHLMFREGYAPGAYFGQVVAEAERASDGSIVPGSIVFLPGNLGPDGTPATDATMDRYLGDQEPSNEQNLSATLTVFGRLRLYTLFDRAAGHVKFDQSNEFRSPFIPNATGSREFALRQAESTPEEQASMEIGDKALTPLFVFDADYVKWRELTLSYDVPASIVSKLRFINGLGITVGGRNLATFTGYEGLDPELRFDGGRDSFNASEFFSQPPVRTFFARLNVVF